MTKGTYLDSLDSTGGSRLQITWAVSANQNITNNIWPELPEESAMFRRKVITLQQRKLVSWCFEPSQPHRIASGLNTNFDLSPSSSFHKSLYYVFFHSNDNSNSIHNFGTQKQRKKQTKTRMFLSLFIFRGHSTQEPASGRVTYFILLAYTGTGMSHG